MSFEPLCLKVNLVRVLDGYGLAKGASFVGASARGVVVEIKTSGSQFVSETGLETWPLTDLPKLRLHKRSLRALPAGRRRIAAPG